MMVSILWTLFIVAQGVYGNLESMGIWFMNGNNGQLRDFEAAEHGDL